MRKHGTHTSTKTRVLAESLTRRKQSDRRGTPKILIVNAHEARTVFVLKRGKGTGFSGVENPLFTNDNTVMIYGDAKATVSALVSEFNE